MTASPEHTRDPYLELADILGISRREAKQRYWACIYSLAGEDALAELLRSSYRPKSNEERKTPNDKTQIGEHNGRGKYRCP